MKKLMNKLAAGRSAMGRPTAPRPAAAAPKPAAAAPMATSARRASYDPNRTAATAKPATMTQNAKAALTAAKAKKK